jgi:hypothetical protein
MTYPNRKKLTEYPIVTPTLADSLVNIQGNTVKRSTLQSILDLFNVNVPNASTSVKGIARLATQAEAELAASGTIGSIDDAKIITPKGWRYAWNKALTLAWTFTSKINFSKAVNLRTLSVPLILEQGDLYYITSGFLGTGVYLKTEDGDTARLITTADSAFEGAPGIIQIATQVETETGVIDNKGITPLKLRQNQFNSASVTAVIGSPYIVTLNSIAGNIIIPTGIGCNIVSGTGQVITLNNNKITTTSVIEYTIRGYGKILLQGGYNVTTNQAQINLYNADVSAVTQLDIYFKILNP